MPCHDQEILRVDITGGVTVGGEWQRASITCHDQEILRVGVTISDGTPGHSFTADGTHSEVDISGWNLSNLSLSSPNAGSFDLKVTATATEGANGDKANTSLTLPVVVHSVSAWRMRPISGGTSANTPSGGGLQLWEKIAESSEE